MSLKCVEEKQVLNTNCTSGCIHCDYVMLIYQLAQV